MKATNVLPWFWGFWNPQNHPEEGVVQKPIATKWLKKLEKKSGKQFCKVMRALQRSLSEAQKHNLTVISDAIKSLISVHKQTCHLCKQKGS